MGLDNAVANQLAEISQIGRSGLNVKYPKEFELYVCALELIDANGNTLRYFIFPIMPSSIDESIPESNNIKRTLGGITSLSSTTFVPVDITLSGNFGRKFKILLGTDYKDFIQSFANPAFGTFTKSSIARGVKQVFDDRIKTGYGCLQILQEIIDEARVIDEDGPRRLIFYNPSFGTSYVVKAMNRKISMSQESNMIHNYFLSLKGIAPLDALKDNKTLESDAARLNTTAYVQKQVDRLLNGLLTIL